MPIPKPPMSDGETQARMQRALSAWRQIATVVRGVSRAAMEGKQDSLASSILNDLEAVANAFDAWPSAWSHIQDLRAEIERLEPTGRQVREFAEHLKRETERGEAETAAHSPDALILPDLERMACESCKDATGGICRAHQEPECTCYEITGGGHMPGCAFNLVSPYKQCGSDGCPFVAKSGGAYCSTHEAHPEWRAP